MNSDIVKVYYDSQGRLIKTVIVRDEIDYDHTVHDEPHLVGVVIPKHVYDQNSFHVGHNRNGVAVHHEMNKHVLPELIQKDITFGTALHKHIQDHEDWMKTI